MPFSSEISLDRVRFDPAGSITAARLESNDLLLLETQGEAFELQLPGMCPLHIPRADSAERQELEAQDLLEMPSTLAQVGYDAPFELRVRAGCDDVESARVTWRQTQGMPLPVLEVSENGRHVRGRTLPLAAYLTEPPARGVVPISPRTQGRYVLEATLQAPGRPALTHTLTITSAARATGLSSVAVSQRIMLGGSGWHVVRAPRLARAAVEADGPIAWFKPDVSGRYELSDAQGTELEIQALRHDQTPLDCARSECHAELSQYTLGTAMSHALERAAGAETSALSAPACTLDCHVVGERGLKDGGFLDVASSLGFLALSATPYQALPHALQRLGAVRCTSCHGPGAIPTPEGRARILRADVCATCHDAPPTYTHVVEWKRSRMAQSDRSAQQREDPACARCHSTGGFLHAVGARKRDDHSRDPDGLPVGIACAACHAPHGPHHGKLLRALDSPGALPGADALAGSSGGLCAQCHAPADADLSPSASSAVLWLGRVRLPNALGGGELTAPRALHAGVPGGCTGCHGKRADPKRGGIDHSFSVDLQTCVSCHAAPSQAVLQAGARTLRERASSLLAEIDARCAAKAGAAKEPRHAQGKAPSCSTSELERARYAASLVLEDGAAYAHDAEFAAALLDQAQNALQRAPRSSRASGPRP